MAMTTSPAAPASKSSSSTAGGWLSAAAALVAPEGGGAFRATTALLTASSAALAGYCLYEQLRFTRWRRQKDGQALPGPSVVTPVLGGLAEMIKDPFGFWERQRLFSFPGLSWNSIAGTFTVFVTDAATSRHVFSNNSEDTLLMGLHPNARTILGDRNIAFLHGAEHKALRKSFLALFTRKALGVYVRKQDAIICERFRAWLDAHGGSATAFSQPEELRPYIRDTNAVTSKMVFVGPYLDDDETRLKFGEAYKAMTEAFLALPIFFPGTGLWKGYQGRCYIIKVLSVAAARSKKRMAAGHEPECLLDFWAQQVNLEVAEAEKQGVPPPFYSSDAKMADAMMDFLFASQDATTSALMWTLALLADHPDVFAKVRAEQKALRPNLDTPITPEQLNHMPYTRQVVKEILRFRPPAPMVIQIAQQDFQLTDNYVAPKGSLVVPSVWAACMQGYEKPEVFDPDRFGPERQEDVKCASNYLVFGHGPHQCVGKEYAYNQLTCFVARLASSVDLQRVKSKVSNEVQYLPTIYPGDSIFGFKWATPTARNCGLPGKA